jgi:hypothetical protein
MASCTLAAPVPGADAIVSLRHRLREDPRFAEALHHTATTMEAAQLCQAAGLMVTPEQIWRQRGTLFADGLPTWRG